MEAIITTLTSSIGIGTLVFFLLKSFLGEKFKNMATLQDIGNITREVESVKQTFTNQTEELKHSLTILTNKENVLFAEEKESLLAYLSAWNIWNSQLEKMVSSFLSKEDEEHKEWFDLIEKFKEENDKANDKIQICVSKLELFMTDKSIISIVYNLNTETYQFQFLNEKYIDNWMHHTITLEQFYGKYSIANNEENIEEQEKWMDMISNEMNKREKAHQEYNINLLELGERIFQLKTEFITSSKEYIRKGIV
jgi:hypothetical protein